MLVYLCRQVKNKKGNSMSQTNKTDKNTDEVVNLTVLDTFANQAPQPSFRKSIFDQK